MSNKRKEIRHAFQTLLKGRTRALFSVHSSRTRAIWEEELPAINVWTGDEEPEVAGIAPFRYKRTLEVVIELYLRSVHDIDDDMDDFMSEVENIVDGQDLFSLNQSVDQIVYSQSHVELQGETAKEGAVATLKYSVVYYTFAGADASKLDGLEGIDAEWKPNEDLLTLDSIDLPQI